MTTRNDGEDTINELADDLEDLKTTVEELHADPPADVDPDTLQRVQGALQDARDATAELEDQLEEGGTPVPKE